MDHIRQIPFIAIGIILLVKACRFRPTRTYGWAAFRDRCSQPCSTSRRYVRTSHAVIDLQPGTRRILYQYEYEHGYLMDGH